MKEQVIEVLGYKVTIESIKGHLADGIWQKEDYLAVRVSYEPHVENVISTWLDLPMENYGREALLQAIRNKAQKEIPRMEAKYHQERRKREADSRRQEDLNSLAYQLEDVISGSK